MQTQNKIIFKLHLIKKKKVFRLMMDVRETRSFQTGKESKQTLPDLQERPAGGKQEVKVNLR